MSNSFFKGMLTGLLTAAALMLLTFGAYVLVEKIFWNDEPKNPNYIAVNSDSISKNNAANQENAAADNNDGAAITPSASSGQTAAEQADIFEQKLNYMIAKIKQNYIEDIDDSVLYDGILKGLMESLGDPYAAYYSPEAFQELMNTSNGEYCGIGVIASQNRDTLEITILQVLEGSPAEAAGIQVMDKVTAVEGHDTAGLSLDEVVGLIKGPEGTFVKVTCKREGTETEYNLRRSMVEPKYVGEIMLEDNIGYIQIIDFYATTPKQFKKSLDALEEQGMEGLIIDLRDNPGGLYTSVCDCLDYMIESGKLLIYDEDKYGKQTKSYSKTDDHFDKPVVILVNGNTASAAEIFSITMQEYGKATIVGTQTFGKGIVQNLYGIKVDNSAVKMTVSKYYSPNGVCVHKTGVTPDIVVEMDEYGYEIKHEDENSAEADGNTDAGAGSEEGTDGSQTSDNSEGEEPVQKYEAQVTAAINVLLEKLGKK